jgi:hypothetical protein
MIRFFSAAFGESYVRVARALLRSFEEFAPEASICVFTDAPEVFPSGQAVYARFDELLEQLDSFHRSIDGQLRNAFKFVLFERMRKIYPQDDLCWIDADMLVFSDLSTHVATGKINVISHGRRDLQTIGLGDGLSVRGDRYAIGGLYSLPPGAALDSLVALSRERYSWTNVAPLVQFSGDQITLNHLVSKSGLPVHWLTDDRRYIYNLEIGENVHPIVGDPGLSAISLREGRPVREGREFAVFCWIKSKLDAHLADGFSTFKPEVAELLNRLYELRGAT